MGKSGDMDGRAGAPRGAVRARARARRLLRAVWPAAALCGAYALWLLWGGPGLPCPWHALTGLWCPGCGISRAALRLLRGDVPGAMQANLAVVVLLAPLALLAAWRAVRYLRTGERGWGKGQQILLWGAVAFLLVFGVLRNLPAGAALAPV